LGEGAYCNGNPNKTRSKHIESTQVEGTVRQKKDLIRGNIFDSKK